MLPSCSENYHNSAGIARSSRTSRLGTERVAGLGPMGVSVGSWLSEAMTEDGSLQSRDWLGGLVYEQMRRALTIFFAANGFGARADNLPDKVIQVAKQKLRDPGFVVDYEGEPPPSLWTVARYVLRTEGNQQQRNSETHGPSAWEMRQTLIPRRDDSEPARTRIQEQGTRCLDECLENITETWRLLILEYDRGEGVEKKRIRQQLADELGISMNALRFRIFKIRRTLRECVMSCRQKGSKSASSSS